MPTSRGRGNPNLPTAPLPASWTGVHPPPVRSAARGVASPDPDGVWGCLWSGWTLYALGRRRPWPRAVGPNRASVRGRLWSRRLYRIGDRRGAAPRWGRDDGAMGERKRPGLDVGGRWESWDVREPCGAGYVVLADLERMPGQGAGLPGRAAGSHPGLRPVPHRLLRARSGRGGGSRGCARERAGRHPALGWPGAGRYDPGVPGSRLPGGSGGAARLPLAQGLGPVRPDLPPVTPHLGVPIPPAAIRTPVPRADPRGDVPGGGDRGGLGLQADPPVVPGGHGQRHRPSGVPAHASGGGGRGHARTAGARSPAPGRRHAPEPQGSGLRGRALGVPAPHGPLGGRLPRRPSPRTPTMPPGVLRVGPGG